MTLKNRLLDEYCNVNAVATRNDNLILEEIFLGRLI